MSFDMLLWLKKHVVFSDLSKLEGFCNCYGQYLLAQLCMLENIIETMQGSYPKNECCFHVVMWES